MSASAEKISDVARELLALRIGTTREGRGWLPDQESVRKLLDRLEAVLDSSSEHTTRTEYRLLGERDGYGPWEGSPDRRDLSAVQREADELAKRNKFVVVQSRTVTESSWEDIS